MQEDEDEEEDEGQRCRDEGRRHQPEAWQIGPKTTAGRRLLASSRSFSGQLHLAENHPSRTPLHSSSIHPTPQQVRQSLAAC